MSITERHARPQNSTTDSPVDAVSRALDLVDKTQRCLFDQRRILGLVEQACILTADTHQSEPRVVVEGIAVLSRQASAALSGVDGNITELWALVRDIGKVGAR